MNPAERIGVVLPGGSSGQNNSVVGAKSGREIDVMRVSAAELDSFLGTSDEEGTGTVEHVEALKVDVAAIPHVERTGFRCDGIKDVDVVQFSVGYLNKSGDRATQIEQRVHLDGALLGPKASPGEHRQAEVDGSGVQGVYRVVEIEAERLAGIRGA